MKVYVSQILHGNNLGRRFTQVNADQKENELSRRVVLLLKIFHFV